jgi:hypothetical protein
MAVQLEFISVIIPIQKIKQHYVGGLKQCLIDFRYSIGKRIWCDNKLFRDGAMSPSDAEKLVNYWTNLGLTTCETKDNVPIKWLDVCVVDELWGPTLECDWLAIDRRTRSVFLKGEEPGEIYGRGKFLPDFN